MANQKHNSFTELYRFFLNPLELLYFSRNAGHLSSQKVTTVPHLSRESVQRISTSLQLKFHSNLLNLIQPGLNEFGFVPKNEASFICMGLEKERKYSVANPFFNDLFHRYLHQQLKENDGLVQFGRNTNNVAQLVKEEGQDFQMVGTTFSSPLQGFYRLLLLYNKP